MPPAPLYPVPSETATVLLDSPTETAEEAAIRLCVIDMGTNSFHAIVFDAFPDGTFETVDKLKEMVSLGEGGFRSQRLTEAAQERGIAALHPHRFQVDR